MKFLVFILAFFSSNICLAEINIPTPPVETIPTIIVWIIGIQLCLRGLAEGLTRISVLTENKFDNKIAGYLSEAVWILGVALGKLGYSVPKLVIEEKAKEINEKSS